MAATTSTKSDTQRSASGSPARRVLTEEELKKSTQRLVLPTRTEVTLKPIVDSVKLTKVDEEKSVKRLYDEAVATKKRRETENQRKHDEALTAKPPGGVKTLTQTDEQEAVSRLYEKAIEQRRILNADLEKKFATQPKDTHLDGATQESLNQRVYVSSMSKHREEQSKLYEKYVVDMKPKAAKRTAEELKASAARLHAGEK